ncbi:hypothetical protein PENOC_085580 [Penicillium occitanis (nom. inval.)]|nr:hypothetical protein PENOC_085580 [Penicillium occitanis (nom. inval.)]
MSTSSEIPILHPNAVSPGYTKYDIVACVLTFVAAVCVALRFAYRSHKRDYALDDWMALAALVFAVGVLIGTILISIPSIAGAGYHITTYTVAQLDNYLKLALASDVLYNFSVAGSKASIVFFYHRIFSIDYHFRIFMRIILILIVGNCLAAALGLIFSDRPVQAQWNVGMPYTSINDRAFWTSMAVVNIVLDMLILGIAQFKVWKLNMSLRRKVLVSFVFMLGAFTIITSILRIVYLLVVDIADLTYTLTTAGIWTNVEMNLSIICACAPVIYSFVRIKTNGGRSTTARSAGYNMGDSKGIITIGSAKGRIRGRFNDTESEVGLSNSAYHNIDEEDGDSHSLKAMDRIHVKRAFQVSS